MAGTSLLVGTDDAAVLAGWFTFPLPGFASGFFVGSEGGFKVTGL